ncbi:MAG: glucose-6-phosphate dehydrogenase assembly protein OpcA [Nocardioides sp.]|uniref:glucose-6-phosphate dehydrogenase assembly protein OpcA n=1 Tax=Nocardioides sp. TaxID=35761 RepID=UPI003F0174EC
MIELIDTTSSAIAAEFVRTRRRAGSPAMGMVMTLIIVVAEDEAEAAMDAAQRASREHPSRVLGIILGNGRGKGHVNAQVGIGLGWGGEAALIRLRGEVVKHPESVVLPLLLPDSPVVIWWASDAPEDPAGDPLGALASRRITDVEALARGRSTALLRQYRSHREGNTDLAWTRLTLWRGLLAAALDQHPAKVTAASVTAERGHPSAALLRAWLTDRLRVPVAEHTSPGPAITEVRLETKAGAIVISRPDGRTATLSSPGHPDRPAALRIRDLHELLAEELRHLDDDDIYGATLKRLAQLVED